MNYVLDPKAIICRGCGVYVDCKSPLKNKATKNAVCFTRLKPVTLCDPAKCGKRFYVCESPKKLKVFSPSECNLYGVLLEQDIPKPEPKKIIACNKCAIYSTCKIGSKGTLENCRAFTVTKPVVILCESCPRIHRCDLSIKNKVTSVLQCKEINVPIPKYVYEYQKEKPVPYVPVLAPQPQLFAIQFSLQTKKMLERNVSWIDGAAPPSLTVLGQVEDKKWSKEGLQIKIGTAFEQAITAFFQNQPNATLKTVNVELDIKPNQQIEPDDDLRKITVTDLLTINVYVVFSSMDKNFRLVNFDSAIKQAKILLRSGTKIVPVRNWLASAVITSGPEFTQLNT